MRFFFIAGEPSGDLHGGLLIKALRQARPDFEAEAWGGDHMAAAGAVLRKHIRELAFMGVLDVLRNLPRIWANLGQARRDIAAFAPDAVVLIDYGGFNLRMAKWAHQQGYRVFYYISPQVWASREGRVEKIRRYVDRMFCILPFEQAFYARHGMEVAYVGHPLLDIISQKRPDIAEAEAFREANGLDARPLVALLPGSRRQEVRRMLGIMVKTALAFPERQWVVGAASALPPDFFEELLLALGRPANVSVLYGQTYALLQNADAALVTSGTATLETALHGVPQVVCYRTDPVFFAVARQVVRVPFIAMVNLILGRAAVCERIQGQCTPEALATALRQLDQPVMREKMLQDYAELRALLGQGGAADRAAKEMLQLAETSFSRKG